MFTAQVKRALWLLRHQQLGYMTQLQKQLLEVLLQQWSRTEVVQVGGWRGVVGPNRSRTRQEASWLTAALRPMVPVTFTFTPVLALECAARAASLAVTPVHAFP